MKKIFENTSLSDLDSVANFIVNQFKDSRIFAFYGEMGGGKTTLISKIVKNLNGNTVTSSPTFSLVNIYSGKHEIYHFDCYRINSVEEMCAIGFEEYLYSGNYCFIEWPNIISDYLPEETVYIEIKACEDKNKRTFVIKTDNERI